jgi:hypothetical protein
MRSMSHTLSWTNSTYELPSWINGDLIVSGSWDAAREKRLKSRTGPAAKGERIEDLMLTGGPLQHSIIPRSPVLAYASRPTAAPPSGILVFWLYGLHIRVGCVTAFEFDKEGSLQLLVVIWPAITVGKRCFPWAVRIPSVVFV